MAHNLFKNDSMLAVGKTPWHGLGVTLATPPETAQQALSLGGLDWTVSKEPMYLGDGSQVQVAGSVSRNNDGHYGSIVRSDTRDILGVVGPQYQPFQNSDMAALFEPLVQDRTVTIETVGSLYNGRRVWMLAKFGEPEVIADNDPVAKYLLLAHGHDGQFAVRFGFTPIRVVCWNTLTAATGSDESRLVRCLHTSGLNDNLTTLREAMVASEQVFQLTAEQFRQLAKKGVSRVDLSEYARVVLDAEENPAKRSNATKKKIAAIIENSLYGRGNKGASWWHAYNGVTEYTTWQASRSADRRLSENWWGASNTLNRKALQAACEMAGVA